MEKAWWKEAVVYQVYPRSFQDSNGDGIGDIPGIIQRLDYIKFLGANVIWLNPIYKSPNDDNGYDISDYRQIMDEFGSMTDFDRLLEEAHKRGIRILLDLVVNHTSDEHHWFTESRSSRESPFRDYYFWQDGRNGKEPNNWGSFFSGPAWTHDEKTKQYYLHLFSKKQPDLNWENRKVRYEVYDLMRFWLDKGVDGFRMDVINLISKEPGLPDGEVHGLYGSSRTANGPRVHEFLKEMNTEVLSHYDIMTVGETPFVSAEDAVHYAGFNSRELNMIFQFEHMWLDGGEGDKWGSRRVLLKDLKKTLNRWQTSLDGKGWNSLYWNNHDQPRVVSRFGNDSTDFLRIKSAKMLGTCLHMMQGTVYVYQGEELGMTNVKFSSLKDYRDLESLRMYDERKGLGADPEKLMEAIHFMGRDNARTPMQWDNNDNGGFSSAEPWIHSNPNYVKINAQSQKDDPDSVLSFYRKLIQLRKTHDIIVYGNYKPLMEEDENIFSYIRKFEGKELLVLCNFSEKEQPFSLPESAAHILTKGDLIIHNYSGIKNVDILEPYEARVYLLSF